MKINNKVKFKIYNKIIKNHYKNKLIKFKTKY